MISNAESLKTIFYLLKINRREGLTVLTLLQAAADDLFQRLAQIWIC
jgi:hypothetical protein